MSMTESLPTSIALAVAGHVPLEAAQVEAMLQSPPSPEMGDLSVGWSS